MILAAGFVLWVTVGAIAVVLWRRQSADGIRDLADARRRLRPMLPLVATALALVLSWQLQDVPRVLRTSIDLTSGNRNTISPLTRQVLGDLKAQDRPVELTTFIPDNAPEYRPLTILLNQYSNLGATVRVVDPNQEPSRAREMGVQAIGDIFATAGSNTVRVEAASELGITTAVVQAAAGPRTLCWSQGHGELSPDDPILGLTQQSLKRNSFTVKPIRMGSAPGALAGCDIVAVVAPRGAPIADETKIWAGLATDTGRSLLILDPDTTPPAAANAWLAPLGISMTTEAVRDPDGSLVNDRRALVVERFPSTSLVTDGLPSLVLLNAAGLDVDGQGEAADVTVLATGGPKATAGSLKEPAVAAVVDRSRLEGADASARVLRARTLVVTDSDWLNNETLTLSGNEQFLLKGLRFLAQPDPVVAIGSPAVTDLLVLTPKDVRRVNVLMFGVPSALAIAGAALAFLWRRRRRHSASPMKSD